MQLTNRQPIVPLHTRPGGIRIGTRQIATRFWDDPGNAGKVNTGEGKTGEGEGGDGGKGDGDGDGDDSGRVEFTPEQQAALNKIVAREARKAAEKAKRDAEQAAKDAKDAEDRKKEQDDAAERGEFDKVRTALEGERDDFKARFEAAMAIITPQVGAQWGDLPEEVTELYEGEEDDALAKADHIHRHRKLIERLSPKEPEKGNGPGPDRKGGSGPEVKSLLSKRRAGFSN